MTGNTKQVTLILEIAAKIHEWRLLTGERRADLILLLDDLLTEVQNSEAEAQAATL